MDAISNYIASFIRTDHPQLDLLEEENAQRTDIQPSVGLDAGKLLGLLVRALQAKRVLELGTCLGYSTIWLASALRETGGRLTSIEFRPDLVETTRHNLQAAGLEDQVELIQGDAKEVLERLEGPYDLILQDSDKNLYAPLLDRCVQLTRLHGLIVADDVLFVPMGIPEKFSKPVHAYNERVFADPRLYTTILPIGDGVALSVKIAE
jgi:predicted O-methyltransferase YrrM